MNIYLLHYPKGNKMEYSIGLIKNIDDYTIRHLCDSSGGSSGAPIINSMNFQVIGIHIGGAVRGNYNLGTLLKEPLLKFKDKNEIKPQRIIKIKLEEDPHNEYNLICHHCKCNCHFNCKCCWPQIFWMQKNPKVCCAIKDGKCLNCGCSIDCHSREKKRYFKHEYEYLSQNK